MTEHSKRLSNLVAALPTALPDVTFRNPFIASMESNYASAFHERLVRQIAEFDKTLDDAHEVGVRLVSFGQSLVFHVEKLGYHNPSLIFFYGRTDSGEKVQLVQHVSQISFVLMSVKRADPTTPKSKIGFCSEGTENKGQ